MEPVQRPRVRTSCAVKPREWFLVPLEAIDHAVQRIRDGSITDAVYDLSTARVMTRTV